MQNLCGTAVVKAWQKLRGRFCCSTTRFARKRVSGLKRDSAAGNPRKLRGPPRKPSPLSLQQHLFVVICWQKKEPQHRIECSHLLVPCLKATCQVRVRPGKHKPTCARGRVSRTLSCGRGYLILERILRIMQPGTHTQQRPKRSV